MRVRYEHRLTTEWTSSMVRFEVEGVGPLSPLVLEYLPVPNLARVRVEGRPVLAKAWRDGEVELENGKLTHRPCLPDRETTLMHVTQLGDRAQARVLTCPFFLLRVEAPADAFGWARPDLALGNNLSLARFLMRLTSALVTFRFVQDLGQTLGRSPQDHFLDSLAEKAVWQDETRRNDWLDWITVYLSTHPVAAAGRVLGLLPPPDFLHETQVQDSDLGQFQAALAYLALGLGQEVP